MTHIGLFEGIGGFSLAARSMGWHTVAWCEWDKMCQRHLRYHFPEAEGFGDITKTDFTKYADKIDILTGGFPCQPYSTAGKRLGTADTRHLWPEMLRAIREISPRWVVGENVFGIVNWNGGMVFDEVQADLEAEGYEVQPYVLPACAVNAPHRRDRVWFVAYANERTKGPSRTSTGTIGKGSGNNDEPKERGKQTEQHFRYGNVYGIDSDTGLQRPPFDEKQTAGLEQCDKGVAADTTGNRRKRKGKEVASEKGFQAESESDGIVAGRFKGFRGNESASNPDSHVGREGWMYQERPEASAGYPCPCGSCSDQRPNWQNFPTQSPVCGRDDGLPTQLDGVTFSKWRQWSIKSYGNAVVPQVVFQIYKAIQQYQSL